MAKSIGIRPFALSPLCISALIPQTSPVCLHYSNQDSKTKKLNPKDLSPGPPNILQDEISRIGFPMMMPCALWSRTLRSGSPRRQSNLDLGVEGLPPLPSWRRWVLVEGVLDQSLARAGQAGIAIDLARWVDLPSPRQERLRRLSVALS